MSRHGNRDNFRDYEEGDHLEWNISRWWAQNLCQLLEYSRLESTFTTSALSVLLSPQPVWLFIASHLRHQLTLFHTRHLVPLILIAWCSWEIKDLYFIGPFCLLTESKPVTNAAILRFELFTGLSLWGPLGPGRVTCMLWVKEMFPHLSLTYRCRVTHICDSKLTIIGSDTGLSPGRCQAIIWTNAGILLIGPLGTNYN